MGYQITQGRITYLAAFLLLLIAILAGSTVLYYLSKRWGNQIILKIGKHIHVNEKKILQVERYFKKYGLWVIIFGKHVPGLRIPITFFAGISGIPYRMFILSTFLSVIFWIAFYLSLGERLGKRVLNLFHANLYSYLLFSIPFLFFIGSIVYVQIKERKHTR